MDTTFLFILFAHIHETVQPIGGCFESIGRSMYAYVQQAYATDPFLLTRVRFVLDIKINISLPEHQLVPSKAVDLGNG